MTQSALEKIPHVAKQITLLWRTRELEPFVTALLTDTRGDSRQGFPIEAAAELMFLVKCNKYCRIVDTMVKLKVDFATAYKMIDDDDNEAAAASTIWSDQTAPKESPVIARRSEPVRQRPRPRRKTSEGGPLSWFGRSLMFLMTSKLFWVTIVGALSAKLVMSQMGF